MRMWVAYLGKGKMLTSPPRDVCALFVLSGMRGPFHCSISTTYGVTVASVYVPVVEMPLGCGAPVLLRWLGYMLP